MHGRALVLVYLVELVHARYPAACYDKGACLQRPAAVPKLVLFCRRSKPNASHGLAAHVNPLRRKVAHVLEEARLCRTRVAYQQDVYVVADGRTSGHELVLRAPEKLEGKRLLHLVVAVYSRR